MGVDFTDRFYTHEVAKGHRIIVRVDGQEVASEVGDQEFINVISDYARHHIRGLPEFLLTDDKAKSVREFWRNVTKPVGPITYTKCQSEPGLTWRRLPFDLEPDHLARLTPTWRSLFARIASPEARAALSAWVWSLFVPESYRQQYVWVYGGGGNGKGALARFLHRVFEASAHFVSHVPDEPNQFWTHQLVNKRLVIMPDCENYHFPSSGLFKTLSGGDPICIEPKNRPAYTAVLDCKFLFTSNQLPALSSGQSDMRRPIFVRLDGKGEWAPDFEERLWDEAGAFLWGCQQAYERLCPWHGPIPVNHEESELKDWVHTLEEPFELVFDEWFVAGEGMYVVPGDMQKILKLSFGKRGQQLEFLKWLDRTHGVRKKTVDLGGSLNHKRYVGVDTKKAPYNSSQPLRRDDN
jgi:hypothetical protein